MVASVSDSAYGMLTDLRQELLGWLALPTAGLVSYALLFADHIFGVAGISIPLAALCVVLTSMAAQWLRARWLAPATFIYLAGLSAATLSLVWVTYAPLTLILLPAVIVLSMALLGASAMAGVAAVDVIVILAAAWHHGELNKTALAPIVVVGLTAMVAWLSHRHLTTAIDWAWNSYQQARTATDDARVRRAELARTLKALDEAYYRLERFSAQLAAAREAAEEARRAKQQFVATVSHELRTPLNIIIGFTELITLSPETYGVRGVPRQFMGDVNRIYRSAQHLKGLIDDVLDLSQIDARHLLLITEQASLADVVAEASDMIWSLASKKELKLVVDVPKTLPPLSLDRLRIRQVLLNLLSNAVRFTERGQITVSARLEDKAIQVTVTDTGPGIAPIDLDRVFEEFRQLDQSLSRRHEGTGLGLALSRRFIELHGGRMWAESELGRGSRFHFTLPLAPTPADGVEARLRPLPIPPGVQAQSGRAILVVTEEPMIANLLSRHLQGYTIRTCSEEDMARAIEAYLPHAVIWNRLLAAGPALDGGDEAGALPQPLPVPLITCPLPDATYLAHTLGVDHYLIKPISRERLQGLLAGYGEAVRRILIVDDDSEFAELLARMVDVRSAEYEVDVAYGGEEGWSLMQERAPDLVLLDLGMENLDGLTLLQRMRADAKLRAVRVTIITARDFPLVDTLLPGRGRLTVERPDSFAMTEALACLQALLDGLRPATPAPLPPSRPAASRPVRPAS